MNFEKLAEQLIASQDGTVCSAAGQVYAFLLKACESPQEAKAEFAKYLSGELSPRLLGAH